MATQRKDERFDLRVTPRQSTLIRRAAETTGRTYTDFIMESALEHAADVLADQRLFIVDDAAWSRFNEALEAPAEPVAALVELLRREAAAKPVPATG